MSKIQQEVARLAKKAIGQMRLRQEVSVRTLIPHYISGRDRFDIVIDPLMVIIEVHGQQHRKMTSFGEKDVWKVISSFSGTRYRDARKEDAAREAGWGYTVIWYDELTSNEEKNLELVTRRIATAIEERGE
jgi:G:T-mismatch repair DNA endonuclease (very short patch repair protein)